MTETMRDVLAEPVEIRGGLPREYEANRTGNARFPIGSTFADGGYTVGICSSDSGVGRVELRKHGAGTELMGSDFECEDEARAEFDRLVAQLRERARVVRVMDELGYATNVLPVEFEPSVRAGDFESLLAAADFQDDRGEGDKALLLRAAYYRATGAGCVEVKAGRKVTVVYNAGPSLTAAVVTAGESIRTVGIKHTHTGRVVLAKEYRVGDMAEYGSYNLTYYGPIKSITAKTVTVSERYGNPRTKRLKVADFVQRNYDFDLAAAQERNANFMD